MYIHSLIILLGFPNIQLNKWSSSRVAEFGYARVHATRADVLVQVSIVFPFSFPVLLFSFRVSEIELQRLEVAVQRRKNTPLPARVVT
jgi:ABC-type transport system involved in cytochrome c biogenesis permease component